MELFSKHVSEQEPSESRLNLLNRRTVVILAVIAIWVLWLLAPSQSTLLQLLSRTNSPQVSQIFLEQMHTRDPENAEVSKLLVDNYAQMGEQDKAIDLAESILDKDGELSDSPLTVTYAKLLQNKFYQTKDQQEGATESESKLRHFLERVDSPSDAEDARTLADIAITMSMTKKAVELLSPHLESGQTSYPELVSLLLQNSDYEPALRLQKEAFQQDPNLETAAGILNLYLSSGKTEQGRGFIADYQGELSLDPDYLRLTIDHLTRAGNTGMALEQSKKLLAITPDNTLKVSTAQLAIATGDLELATALLTEVTETDLDPTYLAQLHALHRWQGHIEEASHISQRLLELGATTPQLREGIVEARALGDMYLESLYYQQLAEINQLDELEYDDGVNTIEKAQGSMAALDSVQLLAALRPDDAALIVHQSRIYGYLGDYSNVIKQRHKLLALRQPTPSEALRFADAYIMTRQPELALQILTSASNWFEADDDYLTTVSSLAWQTSERGFAQQANQQLITRASSELDIYRYIRTSDPIKSREDIEQLVQLYQDYGNAAPLLGAIQASLDNKDQETFARLVELASQDPTLAENTATLLYRAQLARDNQQTDEAAALYRQILRLAPYDDTAINGLLWLAIDTNDREVTASIYDQYRHSQQHNSVFWLAFATAADQLGRLEEASLWYQRVLLQDDTSGEPQVAVLLNYASLLDRRGEQEKAYLLRRYLVSQLTDQLLLLNEGDVSYRSLVALFVGEGAALQLTQQALINKPDQANAQELFGYYLALGRPDNLQALHQHTALKGYSLPDWQKLGLAILKKDRSAMEALLQQSMGLPVADKNTALQLTGQYAQAWLQGEELIGKLNDPEAERQLRAVHVGQHPDQVHGISARATHNTEWDLTRYSMDYYAPHQQGNWRLGTDFQVADTPDLLAGIDMKDETRLRGEVLYRNHDSRWSFGVDIADGLGDQRLGFSGDYQHILNDYWDVSIKVALDAAVESSQLLTLTGKDNTVGFGVNYRPTAREALFFQLGWHDITTRYGDDIGQGWDLNLRASEQLFFNDPAWQIYASLDMQQINLSDAPLDGINKQHQGSVPLTSGDFIGEEYQRLAIGQRVWQGTPALPGPTVPSPRYWVDTSLGYNVSSDHPDVAVSAGLGWEVLGNDEVSLTVDWQSQDRNGDEALKWSLGYSYRF
ncbi:tetratricopeptide repeat protein [Oceanisphaera sp. IT1-181]|uniref:tetratricopeptide repeat protein n=1 Tax=Oceanisphaera sp. IT1-181 TaxID=3081199 RepID=UPI0029CA9ABB|nr:tetratricopeptide repeat protein [Oceanisphaera sp. IT1-181]